MKFWDWLKSIFDDGTSKVETEGPAPEPIVANQQANVFDTSSETLESYFLDAALDVANEKVRIEREMLTNPNLKSYVKSTISYMVSRVIGGENSFMFGYHNTTCPAKAWRTFGLVFIKMCKQSGIEISMYQEYLHLEMSGSNALRKKMNAITKQVPTVEAGDLAKILSQ